MKLLKVGFIEVSQYPDWVANIMPVKKKDGRIRVCVDYRDLNKASPKDDFPLLSHHALVCISDGCIFYTGLSQAIPHVIARFILSKFKFGVATSHLW